MLWKLQFKILLMAISVYHSRPRPALPARYEGATAACCSSPRGDSVKIDKTAPGMMLDMARYSCPLTAAAANGFEGTSIRLPYCRAISEMVKYGRITTILLETRQVQPSINVLSNRGNTTWKKAYFQVPQFFILASCFGKIQGSDGTKSLPSAVMVRRLRVAL